MILFSEQANDYLEKGLMSTVNRAKVVARIINVTRPIKANIIWTMCDVRQQGTSDAEYGELVWHIKTAKYICKAGTAQTDTKSNIMYDKAFTEYLKQMLFFMLVDFLVRFTTNNNIIVNILIPRLQYNRSKVLYLFSALNSLSSY